MWVWGPGVDDEGFTVGVVVLGERARGLFWV